MLFSITIPAYKAKYFAECIDSILAQTYKDFELIIVNDASPEDLGSVVGQYDDPRIRYYVNEKNCGAVNVVDNWNIALGYAQGDYVICMGDDDRLLPNCLEEYARMIETYPGLGVYHAWTEIIDERSEVVDMQEPRPLREDVYSMIWHRWHGRKQFIGDFLFDSEKLKAEGGFYKIPLAWGSDDISAFRAAAVGGVANSQVPIFQYRQSLQTISKTGNNDIKMEAILEMERWYKEFLSLPPKDDSPVSMIFWRLCNDFLPKGMALKRFGNVIEGLEFSFFHYLAIFMSRRKRYNLSMFRLLYAIATVLKRKMINAKL